ncbi:hypothetical protein A5630_25270 [Mycolicibacterium mucogenicum]|uniref:Uncharacterized protein n=1 Tax=Mycolicibacterium mucogenicum TaxID=56689 RepID=A0A1A3GY43_MYCMU|nr:hypothetical protein [Mycolicibacterium mucogenicum]OBJ40264.1 hypothetical protein A5630_25270 [Mycolicibacterium mucogenicum]
MNVGELKAKLANVPDDVEVIVSSDEEGNSYREANVDTAAQMVRYDWEIEVIHPADLDEYPDTTPAVVIW